MAKLFLDSGDQKIHVSNPMEVFGALGTESVLIDANTTGVTVNANVERVDFAGAVSDFTFLRSTNTLQVYKAGQLVGTIAMQGDADGSQLVFTDGSTQLQFTGGVMTLGGTAVPTAAAGAVVPAAIDPGTVSEANTGVVVPVATLVAGAASVNEGQSATFALAHASANTTYTYNISGVEPADVTGGLLTGSVTTDANGAATISVATVADRLTEGAQTIKVSLPNSSLTASTILNDTSLNNVAPVATAATLAAAEDGAVLSGQLVATDADGDAIAFALTAPVEGLTVNADGTYTFNPLLNTAAQALKYNSAPLVITANYTATDNAPVPGSTPSTLTITVTPKPLSYSLVGSAAFVEEGSTVQYTLVASEAVATAVSGTIQVVAGDGTTGQTAANDFGSGSLNPVTVTIAAGGTVSTAMTLTPANDSATESPEAYSVKGTITGQTIANVAGEVRDPSTVGGLGQTFNLTTGVDNIPGLIGSAGSTGTDGNDTINATTAYLPGTSTKVNTLSALDNLNGGLGTNKLVISDTDVNGYTLSTGVTLANIGSMTIEGANFVTADITPSTITGVTSLAVTKATATTLTAAATTDITVSGVTGLTATTGGKTVSVTQDTNAIVGTDDATIDNVASITVTNAKDVTVVANKSLSNANAAGGANDVDAGISVVNATGTVSVTATGAKIVGGTGAIALDKVAVTGGTTVSVTQSATADMGDVATKGIATDAVTQGAVTVTGGVATTSVTVVQGDQVTASKAVAAVAAVSATKVVTFGAMAINETMTVDGLTFTASKALTAAEVAEAFAGLNVSDRQDAGGNTANGFYTGVTSVDFISGAAVHGATTSTVTFSEALANSGAALALGGTAAVAATQAAGVTGVTGVAAVTGVLGVKNGVVTIDDNGAGVTDTITTVSVDGYAAGAGLGATNNLNALTTLSLANSGAGTATVATSVATLALTLNDVTGAVTLTDASLKTLNITTATKNSSTALTNATVETLTVAGTNAVSLTSDLTALKTVTVTGSAGLTLAAATADTVTSINTTGTTGTVTASIDATKATYTGGAGADNVTTTAVAPTKAVSLGAGNDTMTLFSGTTAMGAAGTIAGGAGTDTLSMVAADAVTASLSTAFAGAVTGFERLTLTGATGAQTVDVAKLGSYNYVTMNGAVAGSTTTLSTLTTGATIALNDATATIDGSDASNVNLVATITDATLVANTSDVLNVVITANGIDGTADNQGTITAAGVETINISVFDGVIQSPNLAADKQNLALLATSAKTINITGDTALVLDNSMNTAVTIINASAMTGALTVTAAGTVSSTITGGSGNDVLTASNSGAVAAADVLIGGAGNDTLVAGTLATLTGGTGFDTFDMRTLLSNVNSYSTITDAASGDKVLTGSTVFKAAAVTLASTAVFQDYANEAIKITDATDVSWFRFEGNTYIVENDSNSTSFVNGSDFIIKIVGAVDLSLASFNTSTGTIEFA